MSKRILEDIVLVKERDVMRDYSMDTYARRTVAFLGNAGLLPFGYTNKQFSKVNIVVSANYWAGSLVQIPNIQVRTRFNGENNGLPELVERNLEAIFNQGNKKRLTLTKKRGIMDIGRGGSSLGRFLIGLGIQPTQRGGNHVGNRIGVTRASLGIGLPRYISHLFSVKYDVSDEQEKELVTNTLRDFTGIYLLARYSKKNLNSQYLVFRSGTDESIARKNANDVIDILNYAIPELGAQKTSLSSQQATHPNYKDNHVLTLVVRKYQRPIIDDFLIRFKSKVSLYEKGQSSLTH